MAKRESHGQAKRRTRKEYLTVWIADQLFGLPVIEIQEVIDHQSITHIPKAPPQVAGSLNLRGRIVTAIDVRVLIGLPAIDDPNKTMSVVVERKGDVYSLMVDAVGEFIDLDEDAIEPFPPTTPLSIRAISHGIHQLRDNLLILADIDALVGDPQSIAA